MTQTARRKPVSMLAITVEALREDPQRVLQSAFDRLGGTVTIELCPHDGVYADRVARGERKHKGDETCAIHLTGVALW